jgi:hypothetical protein
MYSGIARIVIDKAVAMRIHYSSILESLGRGSRQELAKPIGRS